MAKDLGGRVVEPVSKQVRSPSFDATRSSKLPLPDDAGASSEDEHAHDTNSCPESPRAAERDPCTRTLENGPT